MAQGQSNLGVGFIMNTSGLKVGLATANAEISKFNSQLRAAVKAGNEAGIRAAQQSLLGATKEAQQYKAALDQATKSTKELGSANKNLELSFAGIKGSLSQIASGFTALKGGVIGLAAIKGVELLKKFGDELVAVVDGVIDLKRTAAASGFSTDFIQNFTQAVKNANGTVEDAAKAINSMGNALADARIEAEKAGVRGIGAGVAVLTGHAKSAASEMIVLTNKVTSATAALTLFRGTAQALPDFEHPLQALGVDLGAGQDKQALQIIQGLKGFAGAGREDYASYFARQVLGTKSWRQVAPFLEDVTPAGLANIQRMREATGQHITPEGFKAAEGVDTARRQFTDVTEGAMTKMALGLAPAAQSFIEEATKVASGMQKVWPEVKQGAADLGNAATTGAATVAKNFGDAASSLSESFGKLGAAANEAIANLPTLTPPTVAPGAYASGGHVRGAGSGTSDSIPAWLSNGEFVMRAAAVRSLGVGWLSRLNEGFAGGGLVGAPPMRFAAGGLASAGGGTPVHLHLGGHVFATTASSSVASALVSEAHRQAVTSAGVKPSWFAARPGGR